MTYTPRPIDFTDHADRDEERITIDIDGDTYARLAAAADAAGETVDDVAERALTDVGPKEYRLTLDDHDEIENLVAKWRGYPHANVDPFTDLDRTQLWELCHDFAAYIHEFDPLSLRAALRDLLAAYPRLGKEFSTAEQQRAVRAARAALGGNE